jgi:hypothetical protein
MHGIVFVPGITGSELLYNQSKIWPPDFLDVLGGYQNSKFKELMDPKNVSVGSPIDVIELLGVPWAIIYKTTQEDLQNISNKINRVSSGPYCPAPYDWRRDLFSSADDLVARIDHWVTAHAGLTEITLVCHSWVG